MSDKQWSQINPRGAVKGILKSFWLLKNGKKKNVRTVEDFFYEIFKKEVTLTTSGRRAIYLILDKNKIGRQKTVFITKFSSFCMYQSIGSLSNVSSDFLEPNVLLINHKWGKVNRINLISRESILTIEDSCDSLIENPEDVFTNNGSYEIISLSKIINSFSGGLIVHNNGVEKIYESNRFFKNNVFSYTQLFRKILRSLIPQYDWKPLGLEHLNSKLNSFEVAFIVTCLENHSRNIRLAKHRYQVVSQICGSKFKKLSNRFGPGLVIQFEGKDLDQFEFTLPKFALVRYFDTSLTNDLNAHYKQIIYMPLHSGISDTLFKEYISFITQNLSDIGVIV